MSYAEDYDDFEQSAQGEDSGESSFDGFCYEMMGQSFGELSLRDRAEVEYQWRLKKRKKK